jgi:hypothetical protein
LPDSDFEQFIEKIRAHIDFVCGKLEISELQAVFFSDLINLMDGFFISIKKIADFINCKTVKIIKHLDEFKVLEENCLISLINVTGHDGSKISFDIEIETLDALRKGLSPANTVEKELSLDAFFARIAQICENRVQKKVDLRRTLKAVQNLLETNKHFNLVKTLKAYCLFPDDELILLRFCHYLIDLETEEMGLQHLQSLYNNVSDFLPAKQQLKKGTHPLQEKGLIQNVNNDGFGAAEAFCLTDKAKDELLFEIEEQLKKKPVKGLKASNEIAVKSLFYPERTAGWVAELTELLQEEKFALAQKRLADEGMRTGFACLFSGGPGTGKTETVYQIARETGRGIMQVDIANTKSMWFGESEKKIKEVFTRYRTAVKRYNIAPILLFNEADAVIGKRQNLGEARNGPGQTENAIQNIILQEIENLNGILIATTNLVHNMDKAFERRFLYKIEFEKPKLDARKAIWQTLIPDLSPKDIEALAAQFDFSGGQIENIARRRTVASILSGSFPSLDKLINYCKEELTENAKTKRIGFGATENR